MSVTDGIGQTLCSLN